MNGIVFMIEEFSVYDGPGIRTSVFLKGCPLKCSWCHNPEGQMPHIEVVRTPNGCINCGKCMEKAQTKNDRLIFSPDSISECPQNLLRLCGTEYTADELCRKLEKNKSILNNGGGVTFSGGEPFFQSKFLIECLEKLKGKIHTAIQTSGYADYNAFNRAIELADYFLFDLKLADDEKHKHYTGVSNKIILENLKCLVKSNKDFVIRIPLIPGVTDTPDNISGLCKIMKSHSISYAELLPYNKMAGGKYKLCGREYLPDFNPAQPIEIHKDIFDTYGINIKIY